MINIINGARMPLTDNHIAPMAYNGIECKSSNVTIPTQ